MKILSDSAIILRHSDYGEADRIVCYFTPRFGRLKGFARGARKSRKRFGAAFEPFAEVLLHWQPRQSGDLVSLREAELLDLRAGLRNDLETLTLASYGCELVEALFDESGAAPDVFGLLQAFLNHLDRHGFSVEARLLFELRLLELSGYLPHLQHCAACNGSLTTSPVGFAATANGSLCRECGGDRLRLQVDRRTLGTLGRILQTPLTRFTDFRLSALTREEGLGILADALGLHLHRPLKTLALLKQITGTSAPHKSC
jgi:DNA repair protein RecO (recombination protein O)